MCERLYIAAMLVTHLWPHTVHVDPAQQQNLITSRGAALAYHVHYRSH